MFISSIRSSTAPAFPRIDAPEHSIPPAPVSNNGESFIAVVIHALAAGPPPTEDVNMLDLIRAVGVGPHATLIAPS